MSRARVWLDRDAADWSAWLAAWRWWLAVALLGAAVGRALYAVAPPPYRARSEVVVDHNLEAALPRGTDRHLFYYLSRENKKLEALAWSDAVLSPVAALLGRPMGELRQGEVLVLRQEKDGLWHFWVTTDDAWQARQAAALWARTFTQTAQEAIAAARTAEQARQRQAALAQIWAATRFLCAQLPAVEDDLATLSPPAASPWQAWALWARLTWLGGGAWPLPPWPQNPTDGQALLEAARQLAHSRRQACPQRLQTLEDLQAEWAQTRAQAEARAYGVTPFVSVTPTQIQADQLPLTRAAGPGVYMLVGALLAWVGLSLAFIWRGGAAHED